MEDIFEEAVIDIDSDDAKNPLAAVEYVEDLFVNYRKMEVSLARGDTIRFCCLIKRL